MPTCASRIMLTSLAPSPMARVIGCSLEAFISFTICANKTQFLLLVWASKICVIKAIVLPVLSAAVPSDSREQRCSCGRCLKRSLYSCQCPLGWPSELQKVWPHQWSGQSPDSLPTSWIKTLHSDHSDKTEGNTVDDGMWLHLPNTQK